METYSPGLLRIEFYTVRDEPNPTGASLISWRMRQRENGRVLLVSQERWTNSMKARIDTAELLRAIAEDSFQVFDLTDSVAAKTPVAPHKTRQRASKAVR